MKRYHRLLTATALLTALFIPAIAPGKTPDKPKAKRYGDKERVTERGTIDWRKGMIYATGLGAISNTERNDAKAYLRARSFARMDARRNLLGVISHVRIDSRTTGQDYEATSDIIREEVSGLVKGSEIIDERKIPMGNSTMVEVTVAMPLYGEDGLARAFIPEMVRRNREEAEVAPEPRHRAAEPEVTLPDADPQPPASIDPPDVPEIRSERPRTAPRSSERYTGVIIDTRGMSVDRCMSPKIRRRDGSEVWGTVRVDPEFVIGQGIVIYTHSVAEARKDNRAGSNPLILKAAGRNGNKFTTDAVLSDEDAERLLGANARTGFLNKFNVIFVVDAGK